MKKFLQGKFFRFIWTAALAVFLFWICPPCFNKIILAVLLALVFCIINFDSYVKKFPIVVHCWRVAVGGLFIFSGLIKANDPLGFSYKLVEYFDVFKADTKWGIFESFAHISLFWAILICVSEVALGFMLLIGFARNLTLSLLAAQIVFFTFLTFYSACFNKVTHCGCFGDFLKLTPWESFWKDVVLMIGISFLISGRDHINSLVPPLWCNVLTLLATIASTWFPIHTWRHLPVKDFRAYAVGENICENRKPGPNYKPGVYENIFLYSNKKTGEDKEFPADKIPWQDSLTWVFKDRFDKVISPEIDGAKITDFNLRDLDGNEVTDSILSTTSPYFLIVMYDLDKTSDDQELMNKINDFYTLCEKEGIKMWALTSSGAEQINKFKHAHNALYDFLTADGITLKTMVRANPGLMLLQNCKVLGMWHHNDWPVFGEVKSNYLK